MKGPRMLSGLLDDPAPAPYTKLCQHKTKKSIFCGEAIQRELLLALLMS
jgi:hypothetical protein